MASLNKVMLIGHLGKDPEVKTFENGGKVAHVTMATSEKYKDKAGNLVEHTEWHNLEFWGDQAKAAELYFRKGKLLFVEGKLKTDSWEDNGIKKYKTVIRVFSFSFLGSPAGENKPATANGTAPAGNVPNPDEFVNANSIDDLPF